MIMTDLPSLNLLMETPVQISVEIGAARQSIRGVLELVPGSVLTLDCGPDSPAILYANGRPLARGAIVTNGARIAVQISDFDPTGKEASGEP